jgi:NitT/TauT family transport system substrate-binding protein
MFCITAPSESVISSWTSEEGKVQLKAVATILQKDTSAIVTKKDSGIETVASLDNKKYASYEGRFEMAIVKQMIKNAGGVGDVIEILPPKLDCFDTVLRNDADATWVFMAWEGIQAIRDNIPLNVFSLSESGVPYGYTPILLAHPKYCDGSSELNIILLKKFLEVTARAYIYASKYPEEAADALMTSNHPSLSKYGRDFIIESQQYLSDGQYYLNSKEIWGTMEPTRWSDFVDWLFLNKCILARDGSVLPR